MEDRASIEVRKGINWRIERLRLMGTGKRRVFIFRRPANAREPLKVLAKKGPVGIRSAATLMMEPLRDEMKIDF